MKIIHRPHNGSLVYGITHVEIEDDGTETIVPPELICRAKQTILKDSSFRWVSNEEGKRLHAMLEDALYESLDAGTPSAVSNTLTTASEEGYESISTIHVSPDPGFLDHHVLCRHRESGECVDLVFNHEEYERKYAVLWLSMLNADIEDVTHILHLEDPTDIELARDNKALCLDDGGYHVQVRLYRSVLWQCTANSELNQDCLRRHWREQIQGT